MQPESSDGFASVGTILPKEKAALLPGGFFASGGRLLDCAGKEYDDPGSMERVQEDATGGR
jgi:hypothetical protein